jgi:hypothetical protein
MNVCHLIRGTAVQRRFNASNQLASDMRHGFRASPGAALSAGARLEHAEWFDGPADAPRGAIPRLFACAGL